MALARLSRHFNIASCDLIRSRLEASGFHPLLSQDGAALASDGYSLMVGGVWIEVPEEELANARELLNSLELDLGGDTGLAADSEKV